jgi:hypothetical protein
MATAAPHVKLLRQLASAKDDYLSGAFDISWDGAKATLYLVFGRPSHAVFETDQAQIEGEAAIDALLAALPRVFVVSDWRRAMSPHETLSITIDELAGPFVRLAGSYADDPVTEETPEWWSAVDDSPDLPFGLGDFPLLPGGRPLWVEASPDEVHLAERLAELPPSILILSGAKLRAAAVVSGGDLIDAVWIDADDHARGETAGMALLGATKGSLAGYALDDPRVAEALTMLWRLPVAVSGVELSWLDPASMLAAFRADGLDRVLVIDAPVRGVALFSRGGLVAVYSETQRSAVASPERLRSLLSQARGRLTVMERKPRPLAAEATTKPASAHDFFEVAAPQPGTEEQPAAVIAADAAAETEPEAAQQTAPEPDASPEAGEAAAPALDSAAGHTSETEPPAEAHDAFAVPPPPPDEEVAGDAASAPPPPPPAPEASEPAHKPKRSRWGFGRSRKSRAERQAAEELAAAMSDISNETGGSEAATFAGWSVRQPNADPQPVWLRSHDGPDTPAPAPDAEDDAPDTADAPDTTGAPSEDAAPAAVGSDAVSTHSFYGVPQPDLDHEVAATVAESSGQVDVTAPDDAPVPDDTATHDDGVGHDDSTQHAETAAHEETAAPEPAEDDPAFEVVALGEPTPEPAAEAAPEPWLSASWLDDVVSGETLEPASAADATLSGDATAPADDQGEPDAEPIATEHPHGDDETATEAAKPTPLFRTPGPWSWPLAEPDDETRSTGASPATADEHDTTGREPAAVAAAGHGEAAAFDSGESGFFRRDEPVGSQYVDFDEVRNELVQISIVWLGESNAVQVTALLNSTRSTIDDFVATIDTIRGLHVEGQDPASIQAMAREMHQQAAERLCGA